MEGSVFLHASQASTPRRISSRWSGSAMVGGASIARGDPATFNRDHVIRSRDGQRPDAGALTPAERRPEVSIARHGGVCTDSWKCSRPTAAAGPLGTVAMLGGDYGRLSIKYLLAATDAGWQCNRE